MGGSFAPEMKFAGYDIIILTGKASRPTIVWIHDDVVEFLAADRYLGMKTSQIEAALRADLDPRAKVMSVGPAGENAIPWACLSTDQYHEAGRRRRRGLYGPEERQGGRLAGHGSVTVGDARAFLADLYRLHRDYVLTPTNLWAHEEGTPSSSTRSTEVGRCPHGTTRRACSRAPARSTPSVPRSASRKRACYQSRSAAGTSTRSGTSGARGPSRDHRSLRLELRRRHIEALTRFNVECDEWGLDTDLHRLGRRIGHGPHREGLCRSRTSFRRRAGYLKAPGLIGRPEARAPSWRSAPAPWLPGTVIPSLRWRLRTSSFPGYDPRARSAWPSAMRPPDRGACHMRTFPVGQEIVERHAAPHTLMGKADWVVNSEVGGQNFFALKFSGIGATSGPSTSSRSGSS